MYDRTKINILCVVRWLVGGIRTYLTSTYGSLDPDKYSYTFLIGHSDSGEVAALRGDLHSFSVEIFHCPPGSPSFSLAKRLIMLLMSQSTYDIVHTQGFTSALITSFVNLVFRVPHITTLHGLLGHHGGEDIGGKLGKAKRAVMSLLIKQIDIINVVSNDAKENLIEELPGLKSAEKKVLVIQNGVNVEALGSIQDCEDLKLRLRIKETTLLMGYMGRFVPRKGFRDLPELVARLRTAGFKEDAIQVLTVGRGARFPELVKEIENRNLKQYFKHVDYQPNPFCVLKNIDLLIVPSYWETFGLVAAESLIVGTPVLAYDCLGLREVIADTPAIGVETGNIDQLANAVQNITHSREEYRSRSRSFIPKAIERFNARVSSKKLESAFQSLIGNKARV